MNTNSGYSTQPIGISEDMDKMRSERIFHQNKD